MANHTELLVKDVARIASTSTRIVSVEILTGAPSVNMKLISPNAPGRWQIVGFGTMPEDYLRSHANTMNLGIINLDEGKEIQAGINLVETK